jgi:NOL1/NOP2/fmu family ribosome biogenesis protein
MTRDIHKGEITMLSIALNEEAFDALVRGRVAKVRAAAADHMVNVEITLSDIGFARMRAAIDTAELGLPHPGVRYPR